MITVLTVCGHSARTQDRSLLYEISGNGLETPSYVFGTIHVMCPEDLSFSPELEAAISQSRQLVFELDFDDPALMTELQAGLMLEEGQTLKSFYSEDEYAMIDAYTSKAFGQSADQLGTMKPFFLMSMLYPQYLGCTPASMEMELMNRADLSTTEIMGIETVKEQLDAIDALSLEAQAEMLLESIEEFEEQRDNLLEMVAIYKSGDAEKLYAVSSEEFGEYEGFDEIMLAGRNRKWIDRMENMMEAKPTFFGVGAAHLGGDEGVINLLRNAGYTVTPVRQSEPKAAATEGAQADLGPMAQQLLGEWKIDESLIEEITDDAIDNAVSQNPQMAEQIMAQRDMIAGMVRNTVKEFKADGTYKIVIPSGGGTQTGTWRVNEDTSELIETDGSGEESVKAINELNDDQLITKKEGEKARIYLRVQ